MQSPDTPDGYMDPSPDPQRARTGARYACATYPLTRWGSPQMGPPRTHHPPADPGNTHPRRPLSSTPPTARPQPHTHATALRSGRIVPAHTQLATRPVHTGRTRTQHPTHTQGSHILREAPESTHAGPLNSKTAWAPRERRGPQDSPVPLHTGCPARWSRASQSPWRCPVAAALGCRLPSPALPGPPRLLLPSLPPSLPPSVQLDFIKWVWGGDKGRGGAKPGHTQSPSPLTLADTLSSTGAPSTAQDTRCGISSLTAGPQGRLSPTDTHSRAILPSTPGPASRDPASQPERTRSGRLRGPWK